MNKRSVKKSTLANLLAIALLVAGVSLAATHWDRQSPVYAQTVTVKASHPRIWLTPERLARLKTYQQQNTARWQKVKTLADSASASSNNEDTLMAVGLAYQVTGNATYGTKCASILSNITVNSNTIFAAEHNGYYYRSIIPGVAAGYDWCYSALSAAQKSQGAKWMMDRADAVWPETTPSRSGGWAVRDPGNNYYWGFMMTWPAALAAYGDDPTSGGTVSSPNRPQYHLNLALSKWRKEVRPVMDGEGEGGVFIEGTNYDSSHQMAIALDAHKTATGQDLINEPGFTFLKDSLWWRIYSTAPNNSEGYNYGDQSRYPQAYIWSLDRFRALPVMDNITDTSQRQYLQGWLADIKGSTSDKYHDTWEFLYYDEALTPKSISTLPNNFYAKGSGLFVRRSDWTSAATYWGIWAGTLHQSHQSKDGNGFLIWKNGWLLGTASYWSSSGILQETVHHNNYTFGSYNGSLVSQWEQKDANSGSVVKLDTGQDYTYFAGQAAPLYIQDPWSGSGGQKFVNDYVRKFISLRDNFFVVYDRIALTEANRPKTLHLHALNSYSISGRSYSSNNGQANLFGQTLLPASGVSLAQSRYDGGWNTGNYDLQVTVNQNQAKDYILNVLEVAPKSQTTATSRRTLAVTGGNHDGVEIDANGGWTVLVGKADSVDTPLSYNTSKLLANHLVVDLRPNYQYTLGENGVNRVVTTTDNGTLRFNTAATTISLTPQGAASITPAPTPAPTPTPTPTPTPAPAPTSSPTPAAKAALTLAKTVDKASVLTDDYLTYTISYSNNGAITAINAKITDALPIDTAFVSASNGGAVASGVVSWSIGTVAPGVTGSVTLTVLVTSPPAVTPTPVPTAAPTPTPTPNPTPTPVPTATPTANPNGVDLYLSPSGNDSAACSQASPCRQVSRGITVATSSANSTKPVTIYLADGSYSSFTVSAVTRSASTPLTLKAQGKATQIAAGSRDTIFIDSSAYVILDGINAANAARTGLRVSQGDHITIKNGVYANNSMWGIFTDFTRDLLLENNTAYGSQIQHGIYVSNSDDASDNITVRGNESYGNTQNGIQINGDCSSGGDGLIVGGLVENNNVHDNGLKGFSIISASGITYQNNLIYNNGTTNAGAGGIHFADQPGCGKPSNNNVVVNNTIVEPRIAAVRITDASIGNIFFNNILISSTSYANEVGGTNVNDASSSVLKSSTAGIFVNATSNDYHLAANSSGLGIGKATYSGKAAPSSDRAGTTRPQSGAYDAGAFEQ